MSWISKNLFTVYRKAGLIYLNAQGRRALAARGYDRLFDARPAHAYPPVWSDLWLLYRLVRTFKPKVMLEFGGGCSTLIYAQALADNAAEGAAGYLYSLDADKEWAGITAGSLPAHLKAYCEVAYTPAVPVEYDGTLGWRYRDVPDVALDFIYLDGPALTPERRVAVDVLDLESRFQSGFHLVVDGRSRNCAFLEAHFQQQFHSKYVDKQLQLKAFFLMVSKRKHLHRPKLRLRRCLEGLAKTMTVFLNAGNLRGLPYFS